jgi:hypothetical protein
VDASGNAIPDYNGTVHFTSSDGHAVLPANYTFTTGDGGSHQFEAILETAGTQSITATQTGLPNGVAVTGSQTGIVVNHASLDHLAVTLPATIQAGVLLMFTVTAQDAYGNTVTEYGDTVTFTSSDPQAVLPQDYTFQTGDHGTHSFRGSLQTSGPQSITAADTSGFFGTGMTNVTAGAVSQIIVYGFPAEITAGVAGSVTVTAADMFGNTVPGYTGTVHFTSDDTQAVLPSNYTFVSGDAGSHTFSGVILKTAGQHSITATDTATSSLTGSEIGIQVDAAAATHLGVTGYPASSAAGTGGTVVVSALDPYGNIDPNYTGTVHLTTDEPQAYVDPDHTFTSNDFGQWPFGVILYTSGTHHSITATDTVTATITGSQTGIIVTPGAATGMALTSSTPFTAGVAGTVTVKVTDVYGNVVPTYTGTVALSSTDPLASTLGSHTFTTGDAGVYTYTGVVLKTAGTQSLFAFDAAMNIGGEEDGVQVLPGAAAALLVGGYPSPVTVGTLNSFTVTVVDAFGNTVTGYTGTVQFSSNDTAAALPQDYMFQGSDMGTHTFQGAFGTAGTWFLRAQDAVFSSIAGEQDGIVVM